MAITGAYVLLALCAVLNLQVWPAEVIAAPCIVCGVADDNDGDDPMVLCDGPGCHATAHIRCKGLKNIPSGDWWVQVLAGVCSLLADVQHLPLRA